MPQYTLLLIVFVALFPQKVSANILCVELIRKYVVIDIETKKLQLNGTICVEGFKVYNIQLNTSTQCTLEIQLHGFD